jgi:2-methylisocitrate lyase-like PEP mutase family enzyme
MARRGSRHRLIPADGASSLPKLNNVTKPGGTPLLPPAELGRLGFSMVIYGISPLMHAISAMQGVLDELARGSIDFGGREVGFEEYKDIVGFSQWSRIKTTYGS